jgi:hypothetical protein
MAKRASWSLVVAVALLFGAAVAQGGQITEATYTIRGMAFEGPATIPAGMTTITVANEEARDDLFAIVSLGGGRSVDEFFTTMEMLFSGELMVVPDWIHFHGGSAIGQDDSRTYTIFLAPGSYYLLSIEGDEEGPYAARGAFLPIEVEAPAVASDVSATLQDYEIVLEGTLVAGTQVVRVHNAANQPHELLMIPLPPGMTLDDMFAEEAEGEHDEHGDGEGPPEPSAGAIQGIWVIDPGETVYVTVDLQSGTYGLVCFVPDADGPHAMQGMRLEVTID